MLSDFFFHLRRHKLPVSIPEYLSLLHALRTRIMPPSVDDFYQLARLTLIKDETLYDRFDQAFGSFCHQVEAALQTHEVPEDWLLKNFQRSLSAEEKAAIQKHGWQKLMDLFRQRLAEQTERHAGGNKWIGTGGTSAFGHGGYHPEGIRLGGPSAGNRRAVKVWEQRDFQDYDDQQALNTRSVKMALRHLRRFAREGANMELDLDDTISNTARNAGMLSLRMRPERHNSVKVLMLLDVGGSMDDHITRVADLFSAARSEFKHLDVFYFHNCPYEALWRNNPRRAENAIDTWELIRTYNKDWRLIFVGDATMSPYEILHPGGAVEHHNAETGAVWLRRLLDQWPKAIWLNPQPEGYWPYRQTIPIIQQIMQGQMYGVTAAGIAQGMRWLSK